MKVKELIEFLSDINLDDEVYFVDECTDLHRLDSAVYDYPNYVGSCVSNCLVEDGVVVEASAFLGNDVIAWSNYEYDIDGKLYPLKNSEKKYCSRVAMISAGKFSCYDTERQGHTDLSLQQLINHGWMHIQNEWLLYQRQCEAEVRQTEKSSDPDYQKYLELKAKYEGA